MRYIFDAWAWIEYLEGGRTGEVINNLLKSDNEIYTLNITIAEVVGKAKKSGKDAELAYDILIKNSITFDLTPEIAKQAGIFYVEMRRKNPSFGIIDAILLISAREFHAKLVTGDEHFKGCKEAILIK